MRKTMIAAGAAIAAMAAAPASAEEIKIGFITTLTTGAAVIGKDMQNAVDLAVEHIGGKMGPLDVKIVYADDEFNSQKGKQATERLVLREEVPERRVSARGPCLRCPTRLDVAQEVLEDRSDRVDRREVRPDVSELFDHRELERLERVHQGRVLDEQEGSGFAVGQALNFPAWRTRVSGRLKYREDVRVKFENRRSLKMRVQLALSVRLP